jgi:hypothetical protein
LLAATDYLLEAEASPDVAGPARATAAADPTKLSSISTSFTADVATAVPSAPSVSSMTSEVGTDSPTAAPTAAPTSAIVEDVVKPTEESSMGPGAIVGIIAVSLAVVGGVGYGVYKKFFAKAVVHNEDGVSMA